MQGQQETPIADVTFRHDLQFCKPTLTNREEGTPMTIRIVRQLKFLPPPREL